MIITYQLIYSKMVGSLGKIFTLYYIMFIYLLVSRNAPIVGPLYYIITAVFVVRQTTRLQWDNDGVPKVVHELRRTVPGERHCGEMEIGDGADAISPGRCSTSATNKLPGLGARNERKALLNHRSCE